MASLICLVCNHLDVILGRMQFILYQSYLIRLYQSFPRLKVPKGTSYSAVLLRRQEDLESSSSARRRCLETTHLLPSLIIPTAMPPRLQLLSRASKLSSLRVPSYQPLAPFLYPFLQQQPQQRSASILTSLSDTRGAYNKKIRRGRGPSSGKGKTSGRGHKGQKQHGKVPVGFQGGQTPEAVVHGKRGFENQYVYLYLSDGRVGLDGWTANYCAIVSPWTWLLST